jgi:hypothetical protein
MQTISEVKKLSLGMPVQELRAKIMEVHKRYAGNGDYGAFTVQNVLIGDGKDLINVAVGNKDEISTEAIGYPVLIDAVFNQKKNEWQGAKTAKDKQGSLVIKISKTGTFMIGDIETARNEGMEAVVPQPIATQSPQTTSANVPIPKVYNNVDLENQNLEKYRSMCIAYAKDLVTSGKVELDNLFAYANTMVTYIVSGNIEIVKDNTINEDDIGTDGIMYGDAQEDIEF